MPEDRLGPPDDAAFGVVDRRKARFAVVYESDWDHPRMRALSPSFRCVYVTLCLHAAKGSGQCWPKVEAMQDILGFCESTCRKAIAALAEAGFIEIGKVQLKRRRINVYTLVTPPPWPLPPEIPS